MHWAPQRSVEKSSYVESLMRWKKSTFALALGFCTLKQHSQLHSSSSDITICAYCIQQDVLEQHEFCAGILQV